MKKLFLALPLALLALFMSGCGQTPDEKLQAKVPESANALCLIDGKSVIRTKSYKDNRKEILNKLRGTPLSEEVFQCRVLLFGSTQEEWGGMLIQSDNQQVRKIYDYVISECKKDKGTVHDFKEIRSDKELRATATIKEKKVMAVRYDDDLMLIAVQKTDPVFFQSSKPNLLFRDIQLKNTILSAAMNVELPREGKSRQSAEMAMQMLPALQKLTRISLNVPFLADDPVVDFRMMFKDEQAANEMLAMVNMGVGFAAQSGKEFADFAQKIQRKAEKNTVKVVFSLKDAEELGKKIQEAEKKKPAKAKAGVQTGARTGAKRGGTADPKTANLKQIGLACKIYAADNNDALPPDFTALVKGKYQADVKGYIAKSDRQSKVSADQTIGPGNTSYAYLGKGLSDSADSGLPLAFEKPWLVDGKDGIAVLFMDGHVEVRKLSGKTCRAIAEELLAKAPNAPAKEKQMIFANADEADKAR